MQGVSRNFTETAFKKAISVKKTADFSIFRECIMFQKAIQ